MDHVHDQDHSQAGELSSHRRTPPGGRGGEPVQGSRLFLRGPGGGGDHGRRRYAARFRDEDRTITIIAGGPSAAGISRHNLEAFPCIAVNDAYRLQPHCEALYAADLQWWRQHIKEIDATISPEARLFCPDLFTCNGFELEHRAVATRGGLSVDHFTLNSGGAIGNSGAQAINLAYLAGARRIVLVGFDMSRLDGKEHWFGDHPKSIRRESPYPVFIRGMWELARDLDAAGVKVLNASPQSALPYWPKITDAQLTEICRAPM